jgi:acyl-CoA dehydrogenase
MMTTFFILAIGLALGFFSAPLAAWAAAYGVLLLWIGASTVLWSVYAGLVVLFCVVPVRRTLLSRPLMGWMRAAGILPKISRTEQEALEAGTVWIEGEFFGGKPDLDRLLNIPTPELNNDEKDFLDGPVAELCAMVDDWEVFQHRDLPPEAWKALAEHRFFGMIIPKKYGGLELSASAVSAVIGKLSSRSIPLGITAMVPNSLGPAELLLHYGTDEQKDRYLPRLAEGKDIPCFALTEPSAGSDAGSMKARGVVYRAENGELMLRLNWRKRYITLASIASLIGLAFKLEDPDMLLGGDPHPGITCALIPAETPGVVRGRQHDPLGVPFYNCPFEGHNVEVSIDAIIGGPKRAGQGWRMLMEQLAAGRGIMLPATSAAGSKMLARVTGSYATVRKQFGLNIGKFEGIAEPLARIGGSAYTLESARRIMSGALDGGAKPAVASAIAKYYFTEGFRDNINDAMDILGGAGISCGPRNLLAHAYFAAPISITVEGANILTRTLMIFGQGAIRCHPFAYREISALQNGDLVEFDESFWGHVGHVIRNMSRSLVLTATRGYLASCPVDGPSRRYLQKLSWASATFAFYADVAMGAYGGDLKRKEILTGRFSDALSWMFLASATVHRFEADGRPKEDLALFRHSMDTAMAHIQTAFEGIFANFDAPFIGAAVRGPVQLWARLNTIGRGPTDADVNNVAKLMQVPGVQRDRLFDLVYLPTDPEEAGAKLETAFLACVQADQIVVKIRKAIRKRLLPKGRPVAMLDAAVRAGIIRLDEADEVRAAEKLRDDAIQVDGFGTREYLRTAVNGGWEDGNASQSSGPSAGKSGGLSAA